MKLYKLMRKLQQCVNHNEPCSFICTYSLCKKRLICLKCRRQHLQIHPQHFIFQSENLTALHSYNKLNKLKQILIKDKQEQQKTLKIIYQEFNVLADPFDEEIVKFGNESREMLKVQLLELLKANKTIIEKGQKRVKKTDTQKILDNPDLMLEEAILEAEVANQCQSQIKQNMINYKLYLENTTKMCNKLLSDLKSMMKVGIKLLHVSIKSQINKYSEQGEKTNLQHEMSFYKRYQYSHDITIDKNKLENLVLTAKREVQTRERWVQKHLLTIKEKVTKINELQQKVEQLSEEVIRWERKKQREEELKKAAIIKQNQAKERLLVKNGIISTTGRGRIICLQKKKIDPSNFPLILEIAPNPYLLDLSSHNLTRTQLQIFLKFTSLQELKYNFMPCDVQFLTKAFKNFVNLIHIQMNSCQITDDILYQLTKHISSKLRYVSLIDNLLTDQGVQQLFNYPFPIEAFYVSYNKNITHKTIDVIAKHAYQIKNLHVAKVKIYNKGANNIGRSLKEVEELYIGNCSIGKQGLLCIARNCLKLQRLSLVGNEVSTEVISQILLGLKDLQWLDISYCNLHKNDMEKVQKLKTFNKNLVIVTSFENSK